MGSEDLEAALQANLEDESGSTTGQEAKGAADTAPKATAPTEDVKTEDKPRAQTIPYERFKEVNDSRKTLADEMKALQTQLSSRDQELGKLRQVAVEREYDSKVIAKINELHADPRYTEIIERLDKAIKGEDKEDDVDEGKLKPEELINRKAEQLKTANAELEEKLEKQKQDLILDRCDRVIDKFFDQLPESYNEEDKAVLQKALPELIKWEAIEENPDAYVDVLHNAFQEVVDWYKTPKGALVDPEALKELAAKQTPEAGKPAPKVEDLVKKDWGKLKDSGRRIKTPRGEEVVYEPEVSDEDFSAAFGRAMRETERG